MNLKTWQQRLPKWNQRKKKGRQEGRKGREENSQWSIVTIKNSNIHDVRFLEKGVQYF